MNPNTFNNRFSLTTFGESHGPALGLVIEDILPGIDFPYAELKTQLQRRRPGTAPFASPRQETDDFQIISGVFNGKTTGMPICILFPNTEHKTADYDAIKDIFRPGHADFSWMQKFKIYDYRGGGRASGRETICRVAAGALVKSTLGDITISTYPIQIGNITASNIDTKTTQQNDLCWPDNSTHKDIVNLLKNTKQKNDTIGALVECVISHVPAGLGDPVFEKLDANLAKAIISIPAVKGIEFGEGFALSGKNGSDSNDQQDSTGFLTNHLGGIVGGVSNGNPIILRIAVRAPSSIGITQNAITTENMPTKISINGRHDTCLVPRILPVIESMITLVLADAIAHQNLISQTPPSLPHLREAIDKIDEDILISLYKRKEITSLIASYKKENNIPLHDPQRENEILKNLAELAKTLHLSPTLIQSIWQLILTQSVIDGI